MSDGYEALNDNELVDEVVRIVGARRNVTFIGLFILTDEKKNSASMIAASDLGGLYKELGVDTLEAFDNWLAAFKAQSRAEGISHRKVPKKQ